MYVEFIEQLIEPIVLESINQIEIREFNKSDEEVEVIILAPKIFFKKLFGKNNNTIQSLKTLVNIKAERNNQRVRININAL